MTDQSAQIPLQKKSEKSFFPYDETFFLEIEKRSYKGARKAIFHFVITSVISFIILWVISMYIFVQYVLPSLQQIINGQINQFIPVPTENFDQEGLLQQFQQIQGN